MSSFEAEPPRAIVNHHPRVVEISLAASSRWHGEHRCRRCWLRSYECYCATIALQREKYVAFNATTDADCTHTDSSSTSTDSTSSTTTSSSPNSSLPPLVEVVMYYFFLELGRSSNTGHLLELLLPPGTVTPLVFGDPTGEQALVDAICREHHLGVVETVVLWPCGDSVLLSEFIAGGVGVRGGVGKGARGGGTPVAGAGEDGSSEGGETDSSSSTASAAGDSSSGPAPAPRRRVRLVALDGTYHTSKRQYKHLRATLAAAGVPLPTVKLDLPPGGCASYYLGIMHQPDKEKICTYQAVVLALEQLSLPSHLTTSLLLDLKAWLAYMLSRKIKHGKSKIRVPAGLVVEGGVRRGGVAADVNAAAAAAGACAAAAAGAGAGAGVGVGIGAGFDGGVDGEDESVGSDTGSSVAADGDGEWEGEGEGEREGELAEGVGGIAI